MLRAISGAALVAAGLTLSGCASGDTKIDPSSPVAAEVARLTHGSKARMPKFSDIPNPPSDIRPLPRYGKAAAEVQAAGEALIAATAPGTWTLSGTDDFAAKARADAGPELPPANPGDAEAFARALRERATPPPPR